MPNRRRVPGIPGAAAVHYAHDKASISLYSSWLHIMA